MSSSTDQRLAFGQAVFVALLLDSQNRPIKYIGLFRGTLAQTSVYPREAVCARLIHSETAVAGKPAFVARAA